MVDVFQRELELVRMAIGLAAVLRAAVRQHARERDPVLFKEGQHSIIQQIGRGDRRLPRIELREADFRVGIDEGLLGDPADTFQRADVEGVLRPAVAGTLTFEFAVGVFVALHALSAAS